MPDAVAPTRRAPAGSAAGWALLAVFGAGCAASPINVLASRDGGAADGSPTDAAGPPTCTGIAAPTGASPSLTPGVWQDISPAGVAFDNLQGGHDHVFTQGMALDVCNPATVYVTVAGYNDTTDALEPGRGLYKTMDSGSTWVHIGPMEQPLDVRVDPRDSQRLYAGDGARGTTNGFWVSRDAGATWSIPQGFLTASQAVGSSDVYRVEPDPSDFDHVLIAFRSPWHGGSDFGFGAGNAGLLESFDGGETFTIHDPDPGWAGGYGYAVFFLYAPDKGIGDPSTWLVGAEHKGYWRTADGGGSWAQVSTNNMDIGGGEVYYTAGGVVYASGTPDIVRSTDNGVTWATISPEPLTGGALGFLGLTGDGAALYTGAHNVPGPMLTASEQDGLTWTAYDGQTLEGGPFELVFDRVGRILYSANTNGGLWALKVP
jgi:hypothetical protein